MVNVCTTPANSIAYYHEIELWIGVLNAMTSPFKFPKAPNMIWGAQWPSGRASDSGARGRGFDTYLRCVASLSKDTFTPRKVLVIPRKRWLRPDMTEKIVYWDVKP